MAVNPIQESSNQNPPLPRAGWTILNLDDETHSALALRSFFSRSFLEESVEFFHCQTLENARRCLSERKVHLLLLDIDLGTDKNGKKLKGTHLIPELLQMDRSMQIVMMTGSQDLQDCVEAMRLGAFGYVTKDMPNEMIRLHIEQALRMAKFQFEKCCEEQRKLPTNLDLIGNSSAIRNFRSKLQAMAETIRPVLLIGETGTGKTHSANLLHEYRQQFFKQTKRPFVAVNMGAIPKNLMESELFGYEAGAFTGAVKQKLGIFELADRGTLFLDEIAELPLELQVKLLTVLEEKKFRRLGSMVERKVDFQLISATNRPLQEMMERGEFREDLYWRISTFELEVPTLKDRREDIPDLIRSLLKKVCSDNSVFVSYDDLPQDFIEYLQDSPFKGNVRGLEQQLSRLLLYAPKDRYGKPALHRWREVSGLALKRSSMEIKQNARGLMEFVSQQLDFEAAECPKFHDFMEELGDKIIKASLSRYGNRPTKVARALGLSHATISLRKKRFEKVSTLSPVIKLEKKTSSEDPGPSL